MKILLFIDSLGSGGAQRQIVGLATMLKEKGYGVKMVTYYDIPFYKIGKYIAEYSKNGVFDFIGVNDSIDDIRRTFSDATNKGRRLDVLYITTTGDQKGDLVGLVTVWDISTL